MGGEQVLCAGFQLTKLVLHSHFVVLLGTAHQLLVGVSIFWIGEVSTGAQGGVAQLLHGRQSQAGDTRFFGVAGRALEVGVTHIRVDHVADAVLVDHQAQLSRIVRVADMAFDVAGFFRFQIRVALEAPVVWRVQVREGRCTKARVGGDAYCPVAGDIQVIAQATRYLVAIATDIVVTHAGLQVVLIDIATVNQGKGIGVALVVLVYGGVGHALFQTLGQQGDGMALRHGQIVLPAVLALQCGIARAKGAVFHCFFA